MTTFGGIRAVTFDVGGTLIVPWPSVGDIYADVAKRHGMATVSPAALNQQFRAAWNRKKRFRHSREQWQAIVNDTFSGLSAGPPSDEFFADLYDYFGKAAAWKVFDDVVPTLKELRARGLKLAVVSNWDERLRPLLTELGLSCFFDAFSISIEVGEPKPGAAIFQFAAAQIGVLASALLHVGDTVEEDIKGAKNAGLSAVLIDRKTQAPWDAGSINSLRELSALLENPMQPRHFH